MMISDFGCTISDFKEGYAEENRRTAELHRVKACLKPCLNRVTP
jgi:hypothetical protein